MRSNIGIQPTALLLRSVAAAELGAVRRHWQGVQCAISGYGDTDNDRIPWRRV
jgi:hypothetical protein